MTSVREAARQVKQILANFREIPAPSRTLVNEKMVKLKEEGIGEYIAGEHQ